MLDPCSLPSSAATGTLIGKLASSVSPLSDLCLKDCCAAAHLCRCNQDHDGVISSLPLPSSLGLISGTLLMCWTGQQPTGACQENITECASTAAHHRAMQSPCWVHMGAARVPQPSSHSPAKPRGLWWTGWMAGQVLPVTPCQQLGSASHTPAHPNLPSHHSSGCGTCSQGVLLPPTAQRPVGCALG